MADRLDYKKLNEVQRYAMWSAFNIAPGLLPEDRQEIIDDFEKFVHSFDDKDLVIRGIYDMSGIKAEANIMIWWHAEQITDLQHAYNAFLKTQLGKYATPFWSESALHRPAEFNKSHLPSFIMGEEPKEWVSVYPFVRSYDWYVMEEEKRRKILAEHGHAARNYPDVRANTVPSFALGDYEWILSFEGDELERIVELMYRMRYTEARLYVREEIPFLTGHRINDDIESFILDLP